MDQGLLERVLEISRNMASTRTLEPLLSYAMGEAINLVGAERGYIVLVVDNDELDFRVTSDADGNPLKDAQDQISNSILNEVIQSGEPLVLQDALTSEFGAASSVIELKLRSVMCVPLITSGLILGAIYVENRTVTGMFNQADLAPLTLFANQAGVAIENAMLNAQLEARVSSRTQELKQALEQLEEDWKEAQEINQKRTTILGNIAHDIRSPLVVVSSTLNLMEDGTLGEISEEQRYWVGKSIEATNHAMALIEDVFDLAKLEMGQFSFNPQSTDMNSFMKLLYEIGMGLPWSEDVEFNLNVMGELPELSVDVTLLNRILFNLMSNSLKFTTEGFVLLYADYDDKNQHILFGVRDTGEGIPPDRIDRLFQRFSQVDENPTRRKQGTGLGLSIARELIELHNGKIWAENHPEGGADFKFTIPVN